MNAEKKLRPEEVSLYRKTFLARVSNGASVEAADRQATHACTLWERRGAFNEEPSAGRDADGTAPDAYEDAFCMLLNLIEDGVDLNGEVGDAIANAMHDFNRDRDGKKFADRVSAARS